MKSVFLVGVIVIVLTVLSAGSYIYYKGTPSFALKSISSAVENRDWEKFSKFVDVDAVYVSTAQQLLGNSSNSGFSGALAAGAMKELIIGGVKTLVEQPPKSENNSFIGQLQELIGEHVKSNATQVFKDFVVDDINVNRKAAKVERKGKIVLVGLALENKDHQIKIPVTFRKSKGHLVLIGVDIASVDVEEIDTKRQKSKKELAQEQKRLAEEQKRFKKISSYFTDSRDGQKYRTVKIGKYTWMAENLNYETGNSWCYEDDRSNCEKYGRLYDWNTAMKACPQGWRLPTRKDWDDLGRAVGGTMETMETKEFDGVNFNIWIGAGTKLKSSVGWWEVDEDTPAVTDEFGFSALPGGYRFTNGSFFLVGGYGGWWTATEGGGGAYYWNMFSGYENVDERTYLKGYGRSLRCAQD
jgi:uncharacterized protein (TIGR02145 family)